VKQTILMTLLTVAGTLGVLVRGPFIAVSMYYLFAVLRPQYLWDWALPQGVPWSEFVAWAAIIGAAGTMMGIGSGRADSPPVRKWSAAHWIYVLFGLWITLTYFTAQDKDVAGFWLPEYLKIFTMFIVASLVTTTSNRIYALYLIATGALIYIAYEVNYVYLVNGRLDIFHNGYGGLDNNGAALMLAMGVPLSVYAWEASRSWGRWIFAAAIPVLVHAVLMTYSRGAMLALVVVAPLLILRSRRKGQFLAFSLAMAVVVPVLAGPEIRHRFFTLNNVEEDASANSRFDSWQAAFRIANDYPIFGVGIRNSELLSHEYGADTEGRTIHSQYLQTLADSGYIGLALYLAALTAVWLSLRRARRALGPRRDPDANRLRSLIAGVEGSLLVFCVGAAFLSLEVFELPYLIGLLGCELWIVVRALPAPVETETRDAKARSRTALPAVRTAS
jgi:probable O-glycosylation ligase (exosortase A-associated)